MAMPRTKTKTKTKAAATQPAKSDTRLVDMLVLSEFVEDDARAFWLTNCTNLPEAEQRELARALLDSQREVEKETERYQNHVAEINAKFTTRLKRLAERNKGCLQEVEGESAAAKVSEDDLIDDELLAQLEKAGEL